LGVDVIKSYLLAPGPTPVPPEVLAAMSLPVIHHRTPQFGTVLAEVQEGLRELFGTAQEVLVLAASGTGAMESAVSNLLAAGDEAIVVNAGKFGERWTKICQAYGVRVPSISRRARPRPASSIPSRPSPPSRASGRRCSSSTASPRSASSRCRWTASASTC
jgi:aspartate aminotransferase-like enzyme